MYPRPPVIRVIHPWTLQPGKIFPAERVPKEGFLVVWSHSQGERSYQVGHDLIDQFLEFAQSRTRPNTLRAYAQAKPMFQNRMSGRRKADTAVIG